ncbi:MAG: glycoside hydrolase family 2 protein [Candidatus Hodarchaeota archaeon]
MANLKVHLLLTFSASKIRWWNLISRFTLSNWEYLWDKNAGYSTKLDKDQLTSVWNKNDWRKLAVPGSIQQALIDADLLLDPFFGRQSLTSLKLEKEHFWLRTEFSIPEYWDKEAVKLQFESICGIADIYLNGQWLGTSESTFLINDLEISKEQLHENQKQWLLLHFRPIKSLLAKNIEKMKSSEEEGVRAMAGYGDMFERAFIRMPQVSFKWDFGTRFIPLGLMKPVWCIEEPRLSIEDYHIYSKLKDNRAIVFWKIRITSNLSQRSKVTFILEIRKDENTWHASKELEIAPQEHQDILLRKVIFNPKLWWPNGFGESHLYEVRMVLGMRHGITGMLAIDKKSTRFGIREVRLLTDKIDGKERFTFEINGKQIFCRGANWVPSELVTLTASPSKYESLVQMISEANINMIRIWGGGIIEDRYFYELCDASGIMIWQDFPFACSLYPDWDKDFMMLIERETTSIIKELWNHPSIVLFCGDNENLWLYHEANWDTFAKRFYGERIEELLRKKCEELVPELPFWISSPASFDPNEKANSPYSGDSHNWNVWHNGAPWEAYAEDLSRFISEFGIQAPPASITVKSFIPNDELYPPHETWFHHNLDIIKLRPYLRRISEPKNLDDFCYFSQIAQAEGLKFGVESFRRRFDCSGCLIWQLNDIWPTVSWSLVDYYLRPKISYYLVKRAYNPIQLVVDDKNFLYVINDSNSWLRDTIIISLENTSGEILSDDEININIPPNTRRKIGQMQPRIRNSLSEYLFLKLKNQEYETFIYRIDPKNQKLEQPTIKLNLEGNTLILKANKLARYVHLASKGLNFSDQFFDLSPRTSKRIKILEKDLMEIGKVKVSYFL